MLGVGNEVTKFKPGDAVFAFPGVAMRCHAEYRCMSQDAAVALKPANISPKEAELAGGEDSFRFASLDSEAGGAGEEARSPVHDTIIIVASRTDVPLSNRAAVMFDPSLVLQRTPAAGDQGIARCGDQHGRSK